MSEEAGGIAVGEVAPDFELENLDGEKVKLSDLKGKKVILNFWASWCPPCKKKKCQRCKRSMKNIMKILKF